MTDETQIGAAMANWATQFRKGLLDLCILNLLGRGEMYGYDLVKTLARCKGLVVTEGTVYPLLSRLKKAALVDTRLVESSSGPVRKYYVLTDLGRRALTLMNAHWQDMAEGVDSILNDNVAAPREHDGKKT